MRGVENKFNKWRYYIDGCNLQEDGKLKVEEIQQEKRMALPESRAQYNLIPVNEYEPQVSTEMCYLHHILLGVQYILDFSSKSTQSIKVQDDSIILWKDA